MKKLIDLIQVVLLDGGMIGLLGWTAVVWLFFQAHRILRLCFMVIQWAWRHRSSLIFCIRSWTMLIGLALLAVPLFLFRRVIVNEIQYIEEAYISPTYATNDSSSFAVWVYEQELRKHTSDAEFQTVRDSTIQLSRQIGCSMLDIYEVAYSECGMNPFCIRDDGVAAGWIQFTTIGLQGLGVTLEQVKAMCGQRDVVGIMTLTGKYMRRAAKGLALFNSTEVYTAVFAPGKIQVPENATLYEGWKNPAYYLNAPALDGYFFSGEKVLFLPSKRDGRITKLDMKASLAYKKSRLLARYEK